jgi:hypothetical protein
MFSLDNLRYSNSNNNVNNKIDINKIFEKFEWSTLICMTRNNNDYFPNNKIETRTILENSGGQKKFIIEINIKGGIELNMDLIIKPILLYKIKNGDFTRKFVDNNNNIKNGLVIEKNVTIEELLNLANVTYEPNNFFMKKIYNPIRTLDVGDYEKYLFTGNKLTSIILTYNFNDIKWEDLYKNYSNEKK